jgi:hypothetical protein
MYSLEWDNSENMKRVSLSQQPQQQEKKRGLTIKEEEGEGEKPTSQTILLMCIIHIDYFPLIDNNFVHYKQVDLMLLEAEGGTLRRRLR